MKSMASGKENLKNFIDWQVGKTNADYKEYVYDNKMLNQSAISRELGFGRKAFKENEGLIQALDKLEKRLREEKVILKEKLEAQKGEQRSEDLPARDRDKAQSNRDKQRLNQLEQQNAALRAQVFDLKAKLKELNVLDEFITETGRMPR